MSAEATMRKRLLIGAVTFADADSALRLAEKISAALTLELGGLMVAEPGFAGGVGTPRARLVTLTGSLVPEPTPEQASVVSRAEARAFRAALSRLAAERGGAWSFEEQTGELVSGLCGAARSWDVLAIGYRQVHRRAGKIILLEASRRERGEADAIVDVLKAALNVRVERMPRSALGDAEGLARIDRSHASVVVLDLTDGPSVTEVELRRLIDAARCPVLIIGAERLTRADAPAANSDLAAGRGG